MKKYLFILKKYFIHSFLILFCVYSINIKYNIADILNCTYLSAVYYEDQIFFNH